MGSKILIIEEIRCPKSRAHTEINVVECKKCTFFSHFSMLNNVKILHCNWSFVHRSIRVSRYYFCKYCKGKHSSVSEVEECQKKKEKEDKRAYAIKKNLQIIQSAAGKGARLRTRLAIYRLYKYLECLPKYIADLTGYSEGYIRQVLAEFSKSYV